MASRKLYLIEGYMPRLLRAPVVRVVPKEGEIEIHLNINITVDGNALSVTAEPAGAPASAVERDEDLPTMFIPEFTSGTKLSFGKPAN